MDKLKKYKVNAGDSDVFAISVVWQNKSNRNLCSYPRMTNICSMVLF